MQLQEARRSVRPEVARHRRQPHPHAAVHPFALGELPGTGGGAAILRVHRRLERAVVARVPGGTAAVEVP